MATPTTASRTSASRRPAVGGPQATSSHPTNAQISAVRSGTTARSAVSPRVSTGPLSASAKRASSRASPTPSSTATSEYSRAYESIELALKRETEEKEALLLRIQEHEQIISNANQDNSTLTSALASAETRIAELYAEQSRMEEELAAKLEIIDKLRAQVKELEKEKRDAIRRYNEQTTTFDAERQTFYDSEQHLKSRIQSLSQARRHSSPRRSPSIALKDWEDTDDLQAANPPSPTVNPLTSIDENEAEPAEMTALKLELATLSTSHTSMQNPLDLLQTQLIDLKRVNNELQEENESYNILLREKTLNGQFDILRTTVASISQGQEDDENPASSSVDELGFEREGRPRSANARSTLDVVLEHDEHPGVTLNLRREESPASRHSKRSRRGGPRNSSPPATRGESLADLPVAGPGLDLAAELGRAQNKDILEGQPEPQPNQPIPTVDYTELQALRSEVKTLKDANKALSLYASKIIDRIIAHEGFEQVLAVDYDTSKKERAKEAPPPEQPKISAKARPKSSFFPSKSYQDDRSTKVADGTAPGINRSMSEVPPAPPSTAMAVTASAPFPSATATSPDVNHNPEPATDKRSRRTLSMDWGGFTTLFGGRSNAPTPTEVKPDKLRPLTLRAGTSITTQSATAGSSVTSFARKVETIEDENDRRERERMLATMKLMGIENPSVASPPLIKSASNPASSVKSNTPDLPTPPSAGRVPFFTRLRSSDAVPQSPTAPLTAEALERAEAESTIAALDAKEKVLAAEYAKGKGASTFTDLGEGRLSDGYRKKGSQSGGRGRMSMGDDGSNHSRAESVNTLFSAGTVE